MVGSDPDDPTGESIASDEVVPTLSAAGTVTLTWQSMAGVTGSKIYRSPDSEVLLATITGGRRRDDDPVRRRRLRDDRYREADGRGLTTDDTDARSTVYRVLH